MDKTTVKRLNLNLKKGGKTETFQCPTEMKAAIDAVAPKMGLDFSKYVKLAINNQLEKDLK